jgi:hypothetical protein
VAFGIVSRSLLYLSFGNFVFENEVGTLSYFYHMWKDEVRMPLLAKCIFFIKDAKLLELDAYSNFIYALIMLLPKLLP